MSNANNSAHQSMDTSATEDPLPSVNHPTSANESTIGHDSSNSTNASVIHVVPSENESSQVGNMASSQMESNRIRDTSTEVSDTIRSKNLLLAPLHSKPHPSFFIQLLDYVTKKHRLSNDPIPVSATYQTSRVGKGFSSLKSFVEVDSDSLPPINSSNLQEGGITQDKPDGQVHRDAQDENPNNPANYKCDKSDECDGNNQSNDKPSDDLNNHSSSLAWSQNRSFGLIYIKHTQSDFKVEKKTELLKQHADRVFLRSIQDGTWIENPAASLSSFLVLCWPELKQQYCWYWFSFVGVKPSIPITRYKIFKETLACQSDLQLHSQGEAINSTTLKEDKVKKTRANEDIVEEDRENDEQTCNWWELYSFYETYARFRKTAPENERSFFLVADKHTIYSLRSWSEAFSSHSTVYLAFNDPSYKEDIPSWILRNYLVASSITFKQSEFKVLCIRESPSLQSLRGSFLLHVTVPKEFLDTNIEKLNLTYVGWEKNYMNQYTHRIGQVQKMTTVQMAEQSATLNVQLMKWRMVPELRDDVLSKTRCLLLGAGTLGSYLARCLLGWGMFNITFVDRGRVSYSNPVRQPLFEFNDCHDGGKLKAEAAAEALRRIYPKVNSQGITMDIPMPGHVYSFSERDVIAKDVDRLETLIKEHDVIFLLMDSRESRWLPTMLGIFHNKIVINSALGFDSFVVMRHGSIDENNPTASRLGCYFCSDVVAPVNSMRDRTMDQQCTVTRPGIAGIAAMLATEMLVNLLHHPLRQLAPCSDPSDSTMGSVPHQIRGSLSEFEMIKMHGRNYSQCIACSNIVLDEYKEKGMEFLHNCFLHSSSLEKLTGLDILQKEAEELLSRQQEEQTGNESDDDFEIL